MIFFYAIIRTFLAPILWDKFLLLPCQGEQIKKHHYDQSVLGGHVGAKKFSALFTRENRYIHNRKLKFNGTMYQ